MLYVHYLIYYIEEAGTTIVLTFETKEIRNKQLTQVAGLHHGWATILTLAPETTLLTAAAPRLTMSKVQLHSPTSPYFSVAVYPTVLNFQQLSSYGLEEKGNSTQ